LTKTEALVRMLLEIDLSQLSPRDPKDGWGMSKTGIMGFEREGEFAEVIHNYKNIKRAEEAPELSYKIVTKKVMVNGKLVEHEVKVYEAPDAKKNPLHVNFNSYGDTPLV